jgi:hypothetical protein
VAACFVYLLSGCGGGGSANSVSVAPTGVAGCGQVVGSGNWEQVSLNSAMFAGNATVQGIYAARDCYVYVSMAVNGTWRAKVADVRTNAGKVTWTRIDAGFPSDPAHGGTAYAISWVEDASGNLLAGIGEAAIGAGCPWCVVGKWNGTTWSLSTNPVNMRQSIPSMSFDSSGNLYINDKLGAFYKSTDGGATFGAALVSDPYTVFGFTSGYVYTSKIINNQMYWGGEGPYMRSPLDFSSGTALYGATGYGRNVAAFASDGTAATAPSYVIAASRCDPAGFCMQRMAVSGSTGIWTNLESSAGIPQYVNFNRNSVVNGSAAGEYFASFGAASVGGVGGVIHSVDGGLTWSSYNVGLPALEQSLTNQITICPFDGSKFLDASVTSATGPVEVWFHQ